MSSLNFCYIGDVALFFSPRDSTGGLGVKMVEYVLGGSPTNKESPLALEPRLRGLKIDEVKVNKQSSIKKKPRS